jgi:gas vesicle protein
MAELATKRLLQLIGVGSQALKLLIVDGSEELAQVLESPDSTDELITQESEKLIKKICDTADALNREVKNSIREMLNNKEPKAKKIAKNAEKSLKDINTQVQNAVKAIKSVM